MIKQIFLVILIVGSVTAKAQNIPSWKVTKLQDYISKSDSVLVVTFWATFCKPCLEELPYFQTIVNKYKHQKVKLLMVSMDLKDAYPGKVTAFAKKNKYTADIVWLNETNADYFCPIVDKTWMGGIPGTLFINPKTGYRKFFEEELKPDEFENALRTAITSIKLN